MQVTLTLEGRSPDADLLGDLERDLIGELELRGAVHRSFGRFDPADPVPVREGLTVALADGGAVSALIATLTTFLTGPRRAGVRVTLGLPDGPRIEVGAERADDVEMIVRTTLASARAHGLADGL